MGTDSGGGKAVYNMSDLHYLIKVESWEVRQVLKAIAADLGALARA